MATDIMEFVPNIAAAVDMCPTAIIREKIIETVRKFCWETGLWVERLEAQDVVAAQAEYDLTDNSILLYDGSTVLNTVAEIVMLQHIELQQIDLETTSERYLEENERGWRQHTESRSRRFIMGPNRILRLVYTPSQSLTAAMDMWVECMPIRTATTVEDFIWNDYRLMIEWGTWALLFETPNVPWNNTDGALYFWAKWQSEMEIAYERKTAGYTDHQPSYYWRPDFREY